MERPHEVQNLKNTEVNQAIQISEPQWVQCVGYRCLAVLGADGKWRSLANGKELTDVVKVYTD